LLLVALPVSGPAGSPPHARAARGRGPPAARPLAAGGGQHPRLVGATTEFAELASVLDALHLRARVADEVAEQSRRTAEQTSAGVFELLSGLVAAEEATRGQLSAELHDTVAQSLAAARALLADSDPEHPDPAKDERVRELVEDAEEQVRAVMARTRPPSCATATWPPRSARCGASSPPATW
jgi:signal transduction histidine kinase